MSEVAKRLSTGGDFRAVETYVDYTVGWVLSTFTMFLYINNADGVVLRAAIGTTVMFIGIAIMRRLIDRFTRGSAEKKAA